MAKRESLAEELEKLIKLNKKGILSDDEFKTEKNKLLGNNTETQPIQTQAISGKDTKPGLGGSNVGCGTIILVLLGIGVGYWVLRYAFPLAIGGLVIFLMARNIKKTSTKIIGIILVALFSIVGEVIWGNYLSSLPPLDTSTSTSTTTNTNTKTTETTNPKTTLEYQLVKTFTGKGNKDTESIKITSSKVKVKAKTWGSTVGSYSAIDLEAENDDYLGAGLSISTKGKEEGKAETIYRNIKNGKYYISVISGINWEVKVYQEVEVPIK